MTNRFLAAALDYRGRGWSVNPIEPQGKKPLLNEKNWNCTWKNYQNSLAPEGEIKQWWKKWPDANLMVIAGAGSGLIILDIDGEDGKATLSELEDLYGTLPKTPAVTTGKGIHYYFKHPGFEVRNFARKLPGLDLRGDGGYVVAPPSIHPSGAVYTWLVEPGIPLAEVPEWLVRLIREPKLNHGNNEAKVNPLEVLAGIPEGGRNEALFKYACRLRAQGLKRAEAEILVRQAGASCNPPLPEKEIETILDSTWSRYPAGEEKPVPEIASPEKIQKLAENPDDVFLPETIGALALMKQENSLEYAKTKATLKGKVNLNDLERAVNQWIKDSRKLHVVEGPEEAVQLEDILPELPIKKLIKPAQWNLSANGVWCITKNGPVEACPAPIILTKRLKNSETSEEKVELAYYRDGIWHKIIADRLTVFNRPSLVTLTNKGLPVHSESAKFLVKYLADLESANINNLPLVKSTNHMGWCGGRFFPGAEGDMVLDCADGMGGLVGGYEQSGTLEGWVENAKKVREFPLARLVMSASFAAPLLRLVGQRIFIIHLWGNTTGGKSASTFAGLSIWGDPEEIIGSFNATKVGLERMASFYCDLPLGIDEKQVAGDKQGFIESIVYLLGLGKGKARGAKGGGIQAFQSWRTVVLTTGEEPLSSSSSTGGIKTRAMEIYGVPIGDKEVSSGIYSWTRQHHGVAGITWINRIINEMAKDKEVFTRDYQGMVEELSKEYPENIKSHISALALTCTADYYASQWIFGLDENTAFQQAMDLAKHVAGLLETAADADDTIRGYEYFASWFASNNDYFLHVVPGKEADCFHGKAYFGFCRDNNIYVLPHIFEQAMKQGGFNSIRVLKDWKEKGWLATGNSGDQKRLKIRMYDPYSRTKLYFIAIHKPRVDD